MAMRGAANLRVGERGRTASYMNIEQLRNDPSEIATLGVREAVDYYDTVISELDSPLIMGHSFGGLMAEILIDRGLGAAGGAIAPAPVKGLLFLPFSTLKVTFPAVSNPDNKHRSVPLTPEQFHYAFTNTLSEEESLKVYNRYAVPGPDHMLFQAAFANFNPHAATVVDFKNNDRAPLLLIAGEKDHVSALGGRSELQAVSQVNRHHRVQGISGALALHPRPGRLGRSR
jgi:pimeloyl-ACP methyl ester carboxylesterase